MVTRAHQIKKDRVVHHTPPPTVTMQPEVLLAQSAQPADTDITKLLPPPVGLSEDDYEAAVMDVFIDGPTTIPSVGDKWPMSTSGIIKFLVCLITSWTRRRSINLFAGPSDFTLDDQCWERCKMRSCKPRYCCDVCNSEAFLLLYVPPLQKQKQTRRQKFQEYTMDGRHRALREELVTWRHKQLIDEEIDDDFFGPDLILTDDMLTRIIDLAHHSKLLDVHMLKSQTSWVYAQDYGEAVLSLAHKHFPPASLQQPSRTSPVPMVIVATVSTSTTQPLLAPTTAATVSTASTKPRKQTQCSRCKALSHNSMAISFQYCYEILKMI